jgi:hypothetical protein
MGNSCTSGAADNKFDFEAETRIKYAKLKEEHDKLVKHFENELGGKPDFSADQEQMNLLRYKVELLLTMLAMEEKSKEVLSNRVETLKWVILSQGTSEEQINELLEKYTKGQSVSSEDINFDIDISSAFSKIRAAFETSKEQIINTLIDEDGNIIFNLTKDQFIEKLSFVTTLHKKDLHVLGK